MSSTVFRRALQDLLGGGPGLPVLAPPPRDGYSIGRRAVAGLLGVRLPDNPQPAGVALVPVEASNADGSGAATASVSARLAARQDPLVPAVILSDLIARSAHVAIRAYPSPGELPNAEARAIGREIVRLRKMNHAGIEGRHLLHALDTARTFARTYDLGLSHNRALDLALSLTRALKSVLSHIPDQVIKRGVIRYMTLAFASDLVLDRALIRARQVNRVLADAMCRSLGIEDIDDLPAALLDGALDDFTDADLSHVNLTSVNLTGIRWSRTGTLWPLDVDAEELIQRSAETAPGSGIYIIDSRDEEPEEIFEEPSESPGSAKDARMPASKAHPSSGLITQASSVHLTPVAEPVSSAVLDRPQSK